MEALKHFEEQEKPVFHGDLIPFNIMVELDGTKPQRLKLIDFGINYVLQERLGSRQNFAEAFTRTELFTAPEVLDGKGGISREADLYSVGMICLDLLGPAQLLNQTVGVRLHEIWHYPQAPALPKSSRI